MSVCGKPCLRSFLLWPERCLRDHEWKLKDQSFWGWLLFHDSDPIFQPVSYFPLKTCECHQIKTMPSGQASHTSPKDIQHEDHSSSKGKDYRSIILSLSFKLSLQFFFSVLLILNHSIFGGGEILCINHSISPSLCPLPAPTDNIIRLPSSSPNGNFMFQRPLSICEIQPSLVQVVQSLSFSLSPLLLCKEAAFAAFLKNKPCKIPAVNMCGQAFVDRSGGFLFSELLE